MVTPNAFSDMQRSSFAASFDTPFALSFLTLVGIFPHLDPAGELRSSLFAPPNVSPMSRRGEESERREILNI